MLTFRPRGLLAALAILGVGMSVSLVYEYSVTAYLDSDCHAYGGVQRRPAVITDGLYVRPDAAPHLHLGHVVDALARARFTYLVTAEPVPGVTYPASAVGPGFSPVASGGEAGCYYSHFLAPAGAPACLDPAPLTDADVVARGLLGAGAPGDLCVAAEVVDDPVSPFTLLQEADSERVGLTEVEWRTIKVVERSSGEVRSMWRGFEGCLWGTRSDAQGRRRCLGGRRYALSCPAGDRRAIADHLDDVVRPSPHPLLAGVEVVDLSAPQPVSPREVAADVVARYDRAAPRPLSAGELNDLRGNVAPTRDAALVGDRLVLVSGDAVRRVRVATGELRRPQVSSLRMLADGVGLAAVDRDDPTHPVWILGYGWQGRLNWAYKVRVDGFGAQAAERAVVANLESGADAFEFDLLERVSANEVDAGVRLRVPR